MALRDPPAQGLEIGLPRAGPGLALNSSEVTWTRHHRADVLAIGFLLGLVAVYLSPALFRGASFGSFDLVDKVSFLTNHLVPGEVHNDFNGDVANQGASWHTLNWQLFHQGQFPLWNDYAALGMPHFFNFESSVLSLPSLLSYLFPLEQSLLVAVALKLLIAGTGAYVFTRTVGAGPLGATFAGATYMLCGAFASWVGWPLGDVMCWTGWLAAGLVLSHRDPRPRSVILLAASVAFAVYGGFPEANVLLLVGLGFMLAVWAVPARRRLRVRGLVATAAGTAAGLALSAPLWIPGTAMILGSVRATHTGFRGLPARTLPMLIAQGFYGLPTTPQERFFGPLNYYETVVYVGVFAVLLAAVALFRWWSRPLVIALVATVVVPIPVIYNTSHFQFFTNLVRSLDIGALALTRGRVIMSFAVAVLAGLGVEVLLAARSDAQARRAVLLGAGFTLAVVLAVDAFGAFDNLPAAFMPSRRQSLVWPSLLGFSVLLLGLALLLLPRLPAWTERGLAVGLLLGQCLFLVAAGIGLDTFSNDFFPATPATKTLTQTVGPDLMALNGTNLKDLRVWEGVGFYPNTNIGYNLRQFAAYDPLLPKQYFLEWPGPQSKRLGAPSLFLPVVDSADLARQFGIGFLLAERGKPPPPGTVPVATAAGETLYRVPGSARFTLEGGTVSRVSHPANNTWRFRVETPASSKLVMRVTYVPGWHVSVDGREIPVRREQGLMVAATVPSGKHDVSLWYWPKELTAGIALAALAAIALVVWPGLSLFAAARRRGSA